MTHRPVCGQCGVEMQKEKTGVVVLDVADFGPYLLWNADLFRCPKCKAEVISGFADMPYARREDGEAFTKAIEDARWRGNLIRSRLYIEK